MFTRSGWIRRTPLALGALLATVVLSACESDNNDANGVVQVPASALPEQAQEQPTLNAPLITPGPLEDLEGPIGNYGPYEDYAR